MPSIDGGVPDSVYTLGIDGGLPGSVYTFGGVSGGEPGSSFLYPFSDLVLQAYKALGPWAREDQSQDLLWFVNAIFSQIAPLYDLVSDSETHTGWGKLVDSREVPDWAIGWLAQFLGIDVPLNIDPEIQRERLLNPSTGWERGTPQAVKAAVRRVLTGSQYVEIYERAGGDPYVFEVRTVASQTPPLQVIIDEVNKVKPAGLIMQHAFTQYIAEASSWAESFTGTVYSCPVPSDTLFPSNTLYPC